MEFIYFLLASWGLTHILVSSTILKGFRDWCHIRIPFLGRMLECYQCTGFWASLFIYLIFPALNFGSLSFPIKDFHFNLDFLIAPFIGSGACSFLSVLFSRLIVKGK
jgi:hypothetical protein